RSLRDDAFQGHQRAGVSRVDALAARLVASQTTATRQPPMLRVLPGGLPLRPGHRRVRVPDLHPRGTAVATRETDSSFGVPSHRVSLSDDALHLHTLANGVRVAAMPARHLQTGGVSVFVRVGSAHESRALNGIGHVLEHMAFKGTHERDAHRVNLDAETLGAEVNAHTDKDHTAYHMRGLGEHAPRFVAMLADIVRHATFPADELAREREVLLQEVAEVEDDPVTVAYQLFDHACWAAHPAAQPVIGQRRVIERCTREQLAEHVLQHYTGTNVVVAAAGAIDAAAVLQAADAAFGDMPRGRPNALPAADYAGGTRVKRMDVGRQMHLVMGYPIGGRADGDAAGELAAAVLGDGMSSPLLAELREKRGLVYHAACNADRFEFGGQLAIEASFAPEHLDTVLGQVSR